MVVSDTFNFYPTTNTRPMTTESTQHIAVPSSSSSTNMQKEGYTTVTEIPLNDLASEKPLASATTVPLRRSDELARPKKKTKPRPFDRVVRFCADQSLFVKGVIIAFVTAIPFVIFLLVATFCFPHGQLVGPKQLRTTLIKLATWLIVCWGSFLGLLYCGRVVAMVASWLCTMSTGAYRFRGLAREVCLRLTMLLWSAVGYATCREIFGDQQAGSDKITVDAWVKKLQKAFMFLMIAFGIILVQGILLELISIQYIEGYIGPRSERATNELEVIKDLNSLVDPHVASEDLSIVKKFLKKILLPTNSADLYYLISRGAGDVEKWDEYANSIWQGIANGRPYLTIQDLSQQLIAMNRDPERGRDLFLQLDESLDNQVTEDEVSRLVHKIGLQLNRRTQAMSGIKGLMRKLEIILSVLVLGLVVFLYVQFFEQDLAKNIGSLWTGIVGLAFAFSGAVSEFTNASVFCFGKHPYDIGDYVAIKGKKYIVSRIFLTHTNFEEVQNEHVRGLVVQMSHASLMAEPITNYTRTNEEATERHAKSDEESGKKDGAIKEAAAQLVAAKLGHLKMVEGDKVKQEL